MFKELFESQTMKGNAPFEEVGFSKITDISEKVMKLQYKIIQKDFIKVKNESLDLYVSKDHPYYILGRYYRETEDKDRFAVIFDLSLSKNRFNSNHRLLKNKEIDRIETVQTAKDFRGNKIATKVYLEILRNRILICDKIQYEGAVELWKSIIDMKEIDVYIYDILEDKIISKVSNKTSKNQIWSTDSSKQRIRLVGIPK